MSYQSVVAADLPLHWWRCSDGGGALLNDFGTIPRAMWGQGTPVVLGFTGVAADGGSLELPGNSDMGTVDNMAAQVSPWSMECWFWQYARVAANQHLFTWGNSTTQGVDFGVLNNGTVYAHGPVSPVSVALASINAWHHLVATYDEVNLRLYLDNAQVAILASAVHQTWTNPAWIGEDQGLGAHFRGNVAEMAFYGSALSAARVAAHFNAQEVFSVPLFQGGGNVSSGTGGVATDSAAIAAILQSVRKEY